MPSHFPIGPLRLVKGNRLNRDRIFIQQTLLTQLVSIAFVSTTDILPSRNAVCSTSKGSQFSGMSRFLFVSGQVKCTRDGQVKLHHFA